MCHYFTQVYPCGYETPAMMLRHCDSDWKPPGAPPRKPPCPLETSTLEKVKREDSWDWHLKGKACERCGRDECIIRRSGVERNMYRKMLREYKMAEIILGTGEQREKALNRRMGRLSIDEEEGFEVDCEEVMR
ncbi:hypothetical protein B0T21DRAFT_366381 [Apiosordaria backusii]|uniref:Uncharacterized protein n=1 Tax=Apiosordaria backusii TaxID=314023 RepID=A0AA40EDP6_9PEZI|nr:hypothetical protein B0T21DRAFT_366381 [Apiosordaria backusii]